MSGINLTKLTGGVNKTNLETNQEHLNNNVLAAVGVKTVGSKVKVHDLIQICIIPLIGNLNPSEKILPFYLWIKPFRSESFDDIGKEKGPFFASLEDVRESCNGTEFFETLDLFYKWFAQIGIPEKHKIMPICYDWPFIKPFLEDWLGSDFSDYFDSRARDLITIAQFINDRHAERVERIPIPKYDFHFITAKMLQSVEMSDRRFLIHNTLACAKVYKAYLRMFCGI